MYDDLGDTWRQQMIYSVFACCTAMVLVGALFSFSVVYIVVA